MNSRTMLITGASSDLGIELIKRNIDTYSKIVAHYNRKNSKLEELKDKYVDKLELIQCDFSDLGETQRFIEALNEQNVFPDHFIHLPATPVTNMKFSKIQWNTFENEFKISFQSATLISQAILPKMVKNRYGKIIFMLSSYTINQPSAKYLSHYTSIKYALLGLMKSLASEYADKGITINGISPSMIETKFLENVPQLMVEKSAIESPLKRNLVTEDVLPTIEFLLSNGADCITGQNISVSGGN